MHKTKSVLAFGAIAIALSGCGANPSSPSVPSTTSVASNVLQLAVGTANIAGTTGLNVVVTYRQPKGGYKPGDSGALVDSPTLTIPGTLPASQTVPKGNYDALSSVLAGPGGTDGGTAVMTSSSQNPGTATVTTFGQSGGAYGLGLEPFNAYGGANAPGPNNVGSPFQVAPYQVPLFDTTASDQNAFVPWGGPPAFNPLGNGQSVVGNSQLPPGSGGISLGLDVFAGVTPAVGTYSLAVSVPANTGASTQTATFALKAATVLGNATAATYTPDGNGGGSFNAAMPAQATEAYVEVVDIGPSAAKTVSCNGASAKSPVYYTLQTGTGGALTLGDAAGPTGTPSICTAAQNTKANAGAATGGDQFMVWTIGFDYPAFESSYPNSLGNPSPTIVGAAGSDDITISPMVCQMDTGGGTLGACPAGANPLSRMHNGFQVRSFTRHF